MPTIEPGKNSVLMKSGSNKWVQKCESEELPKTTAANSIRHWMCLWLSSSMTQVELNHQLDIQTYFEAQNSSEVAVGG